MSEDIKLLPVTEELVRLEAISIHGMLWLQTHFHDDEWDAIVQGVVLTMTQQTTKTQTWQDFMLFIIDMYE